MERKLSSLFFNAQMDSFWSQPFLKVQKRDDETQLVYREPRVLLKRLRGTVVDEMSSELKMVLTCHSICVS